ncbi:hypothetical protein [Sinorhizobium fredii]|uniref:hypothetical protein n=1 Tax=Rhizobium fredii TaxID=380 RepID=UPI000561CC02|nr:hypothetical protein [Sinorhizobium fredii]AWI60339.1 hypothetical protein AB395_00005162 [Sinorhizobium fredii CCBAU 45436]
MTDYTSSNWHELDADNSGVSPNGIQGGHAPSTLAPTIRAIMGAAKRNYVRTNPFYTTTGAGNAFILTYEGAPEGYVEGERYTFFADRANTGAATLNINSLGAKAVIMPDDSALTASQIKANRVIEVVYDNGSFVLLGFIDQDVKLNGTTSANTLTLTTALAITSGGTGANTVAGARTALGLATVANTASASDLSTGTLADARLPTSMAGKTFTSGVTIGDGDLTDGEILLTLATDRAWTIRQRGDAASATLSFENTTAKSIGLSNDATYTAPNIVLTPSSVGASITVNGSTVWHAGNDGASSGLSADDVDGYHATDLYRDNAAFTSTGDLTISNGSPYVRLQDTTASAYDARVRLDANNLYFDGSSDGTNYAEVVRFELDTKASYFPSALHITTTSEALRLIGSTSTTDPYISFYQSTTRKAYIQYLDGTGNNNGLRLLNDVATGGDTALTLKNDGGTQGLEYQVNGTEYTVLHSGNIDTYDLAKYYTGSSATETVLPLGHIVMAHDGSLNVARNASHAIRIWSGDNNRYVASGSGTGASLSGTWRARGSNAEFDLVIFQRTA